MSRQFNPLLFLNLLILLMVCIHAVAWAILQARWRRNSMPGCGRCRYPVRGIENNRCPECGADLNLVGIDDPKAKPLVSFSTKLVIWSLAIYPLASWVSPLIVDYCWPRYLMGGVDIQLRGSAYKDVVLHVDVHRFPMTHVPQGVTGLRSNMSRIFDVPGPFVERVVVKTGDGEFFEDPERIFGGNHGYYTGFVRPLTEEKITSWWAERAGTQEVDVAAARDLVEIVHVMENGSMEFAPRKLKVVSIGLNGASLCIFPPGWQSSTLFWFFYVYFPGIGLLVWFRGRKPNVTAVAPAAEIVESPVPLPEGDFASFRRVYLMSFFLFVLLCLIGIGFLMSWYASRGLSRNGNPVWATFEEMHAFYTETFVESRGFGHHRIQNEIQEKEARLFSINGIDYKLRRLELVGLLKHDSPVVYLNETTTRDLAGYLDPHKWKTPAKRRLESAMTRPLTELELKALAQLKTGATLVSHPELPHPILIGALRADQQSCIECHKVERGKLLGAMVYELDPNMKANFSDEDGLALTGKSEAKP